MQVYSLFIFSASVYCKIITGKEDIRCSGTRNKKKGDMPYGQNDEPPEMIRRFWNIWIFYEYFIFNYRYNVLQ